VERITASQSPSARSGQPADLARLRHVVAWTVSRVAGQAECGKRAVIEWDRVQSVLGSRDF